jgi:CrcB protein
VSPLLLLLTALDAGPPPMVPVLLSLDPNSPTAGYAVLAVAIGGSVGALLRGLTSSLLLSFPLPLPFSTLLVNCVGSFLIGLTTSLFARSSTSSFAFYRDLLITGLYGGLTTFSTMAMETVVLAEEDGEEERRKRGWRRGRVRAIVNLSVQCGLCLGLVWLGLAVPSAFHTTVDPI